MTQSFRAFNRFAGALPVQISASFLASGLFYWLVVSALGPDRLRVRFIAIVTASLWIATALHLMGVWIIHRENQRLRRFPYDLHDINHIYRESLHRLFSVNSPDNNRRSTDDILRVERYVLNNVCTKIAAIFTQLVGRRCVVTMKLLAVDDGQPFCFTWARSDRNVLREQTDLQRYKVGTGNNTGFDEALKLRPSEPSFFYGADLVKMAELGKYRNQREGWRNLYKSTIVVPIRHVSAEREAEVLGFLCVDTLSTHRLNDTYHVHLLAAFADQMFNFVSIMRRRYLLQEHSKTSTARAHAAS